MMKHFKDDESGKIYFAVTREGQPIKMQRTMHSEEFYVLGMIGLFSVTNDSKYLVNMIIYEMSNSILQYKLSISHIFNHFAFIFILS